MPPGRCARYGSIDHTRSVWHAWGVEALTLEQRYAKAIRAGINHFWGISDSELIVDLVRKGEIAEARVNQSATRILEREFALGLFENPTRMLSRLCGLWARLSSALQPSKRRSTA